MIERITGKSASEQIRGALQYWFDAHIGSLEDIRAEIARRDEMSKHADAVLKKRVRNIRAAGARKNR